MAVCFRFCYLKSLQGTVCKNLIFKKPAVACAVVDTRWTIAKLQYSTDNTLKGSPPSTDFPVPSQYQNVVFHPIYRFPQIVMIRALSRLKVFQTGFTVALVPAMWFAFVERMVELDSVVNGVGLSVLAMLMLYAMSNYFRRFIGIICLSEDQKTVRISHLTFWGKRFDTYVQLQNIIPFSDTPENINDALVKLKFYDSPDYLYLTLRYGRIVNEDLFVKVFGELFSSKFIKR